MHSTDPHFVANLSARGWQSRTTPGELTLPDHAIFGVAKLFPSGIHVIVTIQRVRERYQIFSNAEHRLSGPNVTLDGEVETLDQACQMLQDVCRDWDEALPDQRA